MFNQNYSKSMKKSIFLFSLLFVNFIFGQEKQTVYFLQDILTKLPISNANIYLKNTNIGTISNEEGAFQISADKLGELDFSHLEYKKFSIKITDIDNSKVIYLEPSTTELEEVIVIKQPIHELLRKAIETSKLRFNKPIVLNTYYREFVKVNDKYTRFTDGLIDYHINGKKADLIVNQSRAAKLISDDDQTMDIASGLDVRRATTKQYDFYSLQKILFDSKNYEDYDFELKSKIDKSGIESYIINFQPKADLKKFLYKGTIVFNPNTYLISDFEINSDLDNIEYTRVINILIVKASLLDMNVKTSFKISNGNYLLAFSTRKGKLKIWNKKKYNEVIEYKSDLIVTDYKKEDYKYNKKEVYNDNSLYKRGNNFKEKFWMNNSALVLTAKEEAVVKSIEDQVNQQK